MIKTVFIDVDDTLLDFGQCAKQTMFLCMDKLGIPRKDEYFDVFVLENELLWNEIEKGNLTIPELHKKRWNIVFERLGITYDGVKFENMFLENLKSSAVKMEYATELLEYLKSKYNVCITSNAPYQQQINRLTVSNLLQYTDMVFTSESVGFAKPSKEFFDKCLEKLGNVNPAEIIIIGDSITSDISGGVNYGLKTCWFNRYNKPQPKNLKIDYVVGSLKEIVSIL